MSAAKLSNGRYRGRVRDPHTGKQIAPHTIIGGPRAYKTLKERDDAQRKARAILENPDAHLTVRAWWETWRTQPAYTTARGRSPETIAHNTDCTRAFVELHGDRMMRTIDRGMALDWVNAGNAWTVPALRAMFNDAHNAGKIDNPPFNRLGIKARSRVDKPLPKRAQIDALIDTANELTPPSFAAYLFTLCWQGIRPGEADALRLDDLELAGDRPTMFIQRQWSAQGRRFKEPKHGSIRRLPMVPAVRDRLERLPRESEFVFTNLWGSHYTPSARNRHWERVRCTLGLGNVELYLATRHFFVTYAIETLDLSVDDIGWYCGHRGEGGKIVRAHYLHPDDDARRERIAAKLATLDLPPAPPARRLRAL